MRRLILLPSFLLATAIPVDVAANEISSWSGKAWFDQYFIFNNTWGLHEAGPSPWQVVFYGNAYSGWGAAWGYGHWSWDTVKGFPALVRGWHWGTWSNNSGLPRQVTWWDNSIKIDWWAHRDWEDNARYNMTIDCWAHWTNDPGWSNPNLEVMVWYNWNDLYPTGYRGADVWIGGELWERWEGWVSTWRVVSYRKINQSWGRNDLPLMDFLRNAGATNMHLTSIQAGWEGKTGAAQWTTDWYNIMGL